ncbi:MAG: trehalose-phosphatase [Candidatus Dormibacteraeota bacterium]|nr:trehalose-phosphatase [Candidatus Dormibacteraeota bacterium]
MVPLDTHLDAITQAVRPERLLLASDFDGTLAAMTAVPGSSRPLPVALAALRILVPRLLRTAVISGRSLADLARRLPVPGLELHGDYGLDEPDAASAARLREFAEAAAERLPSGARLEVKSASLSLHFRDRPDAYPALARLATELAAHHGLDARRGRFVIEVFPAGADKTDCLRRLIARDGPAAVIFAGDDSGDAGCFRLLQALDRPHLAVGVASGETDPEVFAACDVVVSGPESWAGGLSRLARWATAPAPGDPAPGG